MPQRAWPMEYVFFGGTTRLRSSPSEAAAPGRPSRCVGRTTRSRSALPPCQIPLSYAAASGDKKMVRKGVVPVAEWFLQTTSTNRPALQLPEGSVGHHRASIGGVPRVIGNDDGAMVAVLCLNRAATEVAGAGRRQRRLVVERHGEDPPVLGGVSAAICC